MKKRFCIQSPHSLTGFLWVYIFFSLYFFGNWSLSTYNECKEPLSEMHENVLTSTESVQPCTPGKDFVQVNQSYFPIDTDDIQQYVHSANKFSELSFARHTSISNHQHFKNSSITIRMVFSVLIV